MQINQTIKYENGKVIISQVYEFDFSDFVILELPKSCTSCPCGFGTNKENPCGRNVPLKPEDYNSRPATCRLKTFDEYLVEIN